MTNTSTTLSPLFAIEKPIPRGRAEDAAAPLASAVRFVMAMPGRARRVLRLWAARLNDRAFLAGLHDHQLGDLGMTRHERDIEVRKPFWER